MSDSRHFVIVGGGQAADQAVQTLRRKGFSGKLTLIGEEPHLPYQRPPLSKAYLSGSLERDRLLLRHASYYGEHSVDTRLAVRVQEIERSAGRLRLEDGASVPYDALLLATGAKARRLAIPGADLPGVYSLRTMADVERIRAEFSPGKRLVLVGGGYIGLEVAATARACGLDVVILEMADRVLNRVTCREISSFYAAEHARHGVRLATQTTVLAFTRDASTGRVRSVLTEGDEEHPADFVIVGAGVLAADELAMGAGLDCSNGVVVDEHCRTSDERIFAAGDCTNHPNLHYGRRLRLESVDNAVEQATTAAVNMMGDVTPHAKVPWFWSDQFDLKLITVGLCTDHDTVVMRGSTSARSFSACYLREGELIAIDCVNNMKDQMAARKLIPARVRPDPDKLVDPGIPLRECA